MRELAKGDHGHDNLYMVFEQVRELEGIGRRGQVIVELPLPLTYPCGWLAGYGAIRWETSAEKSSQKMISTSQNA